MREPKALRTCYSACSIVLLVIQILGPSIGQSITCIVPEPKTVKSKMTIGAYWYPHWGDPEKTTPRLSWPYSVFHPILGEYDANDPYVVDWHIKWAVDHGVTLLVTGSAGWRLEGFLNSKYLSYTRFAASVVLKIGGFHDPRNLPNVLEWMRRSCFLNPHYFSVKERPVFFVWDPTSLLEYLSVAELRSAFKSGRDYYRSKYSVEPFIVGVWNAGRFAKAQYDIPIPTATDFDLASMFDGVTIYSMPSVGGENRKVGQKWECVAPYDSLVSLYPTATERFIMAVNGSKAHFIPSATPGFNNSLLFKNGLDNWLIHRTEPSADRFRILLKQMERYVDQELNLLLVEAWNEFSEGSVIEPTLEFGFQYLDAVRQAFTDASLEHEDLTPESYAARLIAEAGSLIRQAKEENRTEGLASTENLLHDAEYAMDRRNFREAAFLASQALSVAGTATRRTTSTISISSTCGSVWKALSEYARPLIVVTGVIVPLVCWFAIVRARRAREAVKHRRSLA